MTSEETLAAFLCLVKRVQRAHVPHQAAEKGMPAIVKASGKDGSVYERSRSGIQNASGNYKADAAISGHRRRMGILAQPNLPIFQAGNGQPLNLDNLARRVIALVAKWHGWHGFRRGLATNLHTLASMIRRSNDFAAQQHRHHAERLHQERDGITGERDGYPQRKIRFVQRPCNIRRWAR